jgi:hypothetical protein
MRSLRWTENPEELDRYQPAPQLTGCGLMAKSPALGAGHHPGSSPGIPTKMLITL